MNELHAWLEIENLGTQIRVRHQFSLEIWRPFPGNPDPDRYRVTATPPLRARESGSAVFALSDLEPDEEWTFDAPGGNAEEAFALLTLDVLQTLPAQPEGTAVDLDWEVGGLELERVDAGVVDRLPSGLMLSLPHLHIPPSGGVERVEFTLEVTDPRINHQSIQWIAATQSTLRAVNRAALDAREEEGVWRDDFVFWTPADTTGGWREGWAGFFPLGEPWRSVDLLTEEGRWWLRHTRAADWREDAAWRRGRVNPNTAYPEALSAVFRGLPLADWPGQPDSESADADLAGRLALDLSAAWQLGEGSRQRGDWTAAMRPALREAGVSPARAESLVAASLERLTVNHQIWGLLLWSRTVGPGGRVLASRREFVIRWIEPQVEAEGPLRSAVLWRCGFPEN